MKDQLSIAMIAGESSGDFLGAGLITAMKKLYPSIHFYGIGGPLMRAAGFVDIYPMEQIAFMGISDVLRHYHRLKWIHHKIRQHLLKQPPHLFIGIDAPDFNLSIEKALKEKGVKTAHYVSPKIWAWRSERVHLIKKAVDLLLTVFPFETAFYKPYAVPVKFVGHPLADLIDLNIDTNTYKASLGYAPHQKIVAVLPGSRMGEVKHIGPLFLDVMHLIQLKRPHIIFLIPLVNHTIKAQFEQQIRKKKYALNIRLIIQQSREIMAAADVVLVKSGTSTLEAALLKKPMVVAYKTSRLNYRIMAPKIKVAHSALPNLLTESFLVPEFIQHQACPHQITETLLSLLSNPKHTRHLKAQYTKIHQTLRRDTHQQASHALFALLDIRI